MDTEISQVGQAAGERLLTRAQGGRTADSF